MIELAGLKVLIVEDEGFVALMIEQMLEDLGCEVAASVANFPEAQEMAHRTDAELAVLDVNLHGQPVFPVAKILRKRQIPLLFSTGYGVGALPSEFASHPVLGKPFTIGELRTGIALALGR